MISLFLGSSFINAPGLRGASDRAQSPPPNIIFFLVDDLGWTDINGFEGPNGETYENAGGEFDSRYYYTPNIAKLRNAGMRFTNAYAACPFCGPARASILTGKYPARIGFTNNNTHDQNQGTGPFMPSEMIFTEPVEPDLVTDLDPQTETSIARALKPTNGTNQDYLSCTIGKWHVYSEGVTDCGPEAHGFDYNIGGSFRGQPAGGDRPGWDFYRGSAWSNVYFPNLENPNQRYGSGWPLVSDSHSSSSDKNFEKLSYLSDALTHRALEFIDLASQQSQPFFLYMSHYGVHSPMQAKRKDTKSDGNITVEDEEVHAEMFAQRWGQDGRHEIEPPPDSKTYRTQYTYASMIKSIDESLGRIMNQLESTGLADNTVIFFYSDNGGVERNGFTSNNPLRSEKTHGYEGGTRVPLIVRGPGISANQTCDVPVTGPDFFPTILELAGIEMSAVEKASNFGFSIKEIDGVSLVPLFCGERSAFHRENNPDTSTDDGAIFWHVPHYKHSAPYSAVLKGSHKYMRYWEDEENLKNRREMEDGYFMSGKELYQLNENLGESADENLIGTNLPLETELETTLFDWLRRVDAKMPTAISRESKEGFTRDWYSTWIAQADPTKNYTNPVKEAMNHALPGDTITVYPKNFKNNGAPPKAPNNVTIKSIHSTAP